MKPLKVPASVQFKSPPSPNDWLSKTLHYKCREDQSMNLNILQSGYNGCKSSPSCFHNSIIPRRLKTSFGKFLNLHLLWIFSHPQNGLCWRKFSGNVSSMSHLRISSLNPYQIIFGLMSTDPLTLLSASANVLLSLVRYYKMF